jgi:hypothetical protein
MKISLLYVMLVIMASGLLQAQHEADNWYFGEKAAITFKNGSPVEVFDSQMFASEGCATMSDKNTGKLLFYTNGEKVWNSKHQIMKNGTDLKGDVSSTQGTIIVPDPGNNLQYYIFTAPATLSNPQSSTGYYSLISLENPEGEVLSKNNTLFTDLAEKITATLDCSGKGYWVVTHHVSKGIFYSFHVTSVGVITLPVISKYTDETVNSISGYMKISPDRTKLALATTTSIVSAPSKIAPYPLLLFNFNAETGSITLNNILGTGTTISSYYGVAFSPDNTKLYATEIREIRANTLGSIVQYDLSLANPVSVQNSLFVYKIPPRTVNETTFGYALQLAPDGKIYMVSNENYLTIIEYPNLPGNSFGYTLNGIKLYASVVLGLPNFMDYIFNEPIPGNNPLAWCTPPPPPPKPKAIALSDSGCLGKILHLTDVSTNKPTKREWTFENGSPSMSSDSIVSVSYSMAGRYNVRLIVSNAGGSDTTYTYATIYPNPTANAGIDKTICPNSSTQLGDKPEAGNKYTWLPTTDLDDPSIANPNASAKTTTQYILTVTSEHGCIAYDTVLVTVGNIVAKVSNDTTICSGSSIQLIASGGAKYTWLPSTGLSDTTIENPIASPTKTTTYKVLVSSGTCEDSAFVTITVNPQPTANAGQDKTLCIGASTEIGEVAQAGFTYQWQPANGLDDATKANPIASPTSTTQYILTVSGNGDCTASDTVLVTIGTIKAFVSNDTSICEGASAKLFASGGAKYEWSPSVGLDNSSIATPTANPTSTTKYKVLVSSGTCIDSAFVIVTILPPPNANAGEDKPICIGESTQIGTPSEAGNSYSWSPTAGLSSPTASQTSVSPTTTTTYTLQVTNPAGCVKSDEVIVTVNPRNARSFTLQPDTVTILPGKQFTANLEIPSGVKDWSVKLKYDSLLVKFNSISGAQAIPDDLKGELLINGNGGNRSIPITFDAFLPHTSDTIYPVRLTVDASKVADCETWSATGNILMLADYCGKNIRVVSSTGKKYYLTVKDRIIDFGIGLSGNVRLEVFDYVGNSVLVVSDGLLDAGEYSAGLDLPVGVYYCRLRAGLYEQVGKVLIAR